MFCPKCGNEVFGNDQFCRSCGAKLSQRPLLAADENNRLFFVKSHLEETLEQALPVFARFDNYYSQMAEVSEKYASQKSEYERSCTSKGKTIRTICFTVGFVIAGLFFTVGPFFSNYLLIPGFVFGLLGLFLGLVMPKKIQPDNEVLSSIDKQKIQEAKPIRDTFSKVLEENADIVAEIPRDYRTYHAVSFFSDAVANGKADTMKECMLQYDNYMHQLRMEQGQMNLFYRLQEQEEVLSAIAASTREAARNAKDASLFAAMGMLI